MPEKDGWLYEGIEPRDGEAYVCSSYIVAIFKAAGLFGDMKIEATEFTPRDLIELEFFDNKYRSNHTLCNIYDPNLPYCQIMGKYRMEFPAYGTQTPYSGMNENCQMISPMYDRN